MRKTVTYGTGTRKGPSAILKASQQLEVYDGFGIPAERGIHTAESHDCRKNPETVLHHLARHVERIVRQKRIPVILGGEHTITSGVLKGILNTGERVGVVQFDAHADLRNRYEGSLYNHACAMRRVLEQGCELYQIGVRSLSPGELVFRKENRIGHLDAATLCRCGVQKTLLPAHFPENIYITIDVDSFDPSIMPATGTPEPGGLNWYQMMDLLEEIAFSRNILGFDVVELAPISGFHAPDFTAARLVYNLMGMIVRHM